MKQQKPKPKQKNNIGNSEKVLPSKSSKKNIFYFLIISAIIALLYFPDLNYKFTNDDDTALIKDNYSFLSNPKSAIAIFKQSVFYTNFKVKDNYYRPVLMLSFFLDTQIAGKHYWFFYLVNILLHLACCILLFLLLQKLIYDKVRSLFFTLIFAVHPVFAQAIAWIPGRNDTLLTLFSLLSFHFLIDYLNRKKIFYLILHIFFFIVALLTKESVVFLPFIFLMYAVLIHNDSKNISIIKALNNFKIYIIVWVFLIIAFLILRRATLGQSVAFPLMYVITNFIYNLPALIQFIGKILFPFYLNTLPVMVDIPIYYADNFDSPDLAEKVKGWILSNPVEFIAWFEEKTKSNFQKAFIYESLKYKEPYEKWLSDIRKGDCQIRRLVRYMKAWADQKKKEMPCGIIMTILVAENFAVNERDDIALRDTLIGVRNYLNRNGFKCPRPTSPEGENLFSSSSQAEKDYFMNALNSFIQSANNAVNAINEKEACSEWEKHLGIRFPCHLAKESHFQPIKSERDIESLKRTAAVAQPWYSKK